MGDDRRGKGIVWSYITAQTLPRLCRPSVFRPSVFRPSVFRLSVHTPLLFRIREAYVSLEIFKRFLKGLQVYLIF